MTGADHRKCHCQLDQMDSRYQKEKKNLYQMDTHVTFGFQLAKAEEGKTCLTWGRSANGSSHRHLKHAVTPQPLAQL
jgi:hypothetical protein